MCGFRNAGEDDGLLHYLFVWLHRVLSEMPVRVQAVEMNLGGVFVVVVLLIMSLVSVQRINRVKRVAFPLSNVNVRG